MKTKNAACFIVVLLLSIMSIFASIDSTGNSIALASMTIEAFKEIPKPVGVFNVTVSYLDDKSSTPITGLGGVYDVSKRDLSSLDKVFAVKIKSNYGDKVKFSFRFGPFVNQIDKSKVVPATYMISSGSQSWSKVVGYWDDWNYYYYKFIPVFEPNITSATDSQTVTVKKGEEKVVSVDWYPKGEQRDSKNRFTGNPNYTPGSGVITQLGDNKLESTIYGSLMIDEADYAKIEPNVDYVSTVVISMEVI